VEVRVISVPQGFGEKVACKIASGAEKCGSCCKEVTVTATETDGGTVLLGGLSKSKCEAGSSCPECCAKNAAACKDQSKRTYLSDTQVKKLMDCLQANPKTNVMMAPKVTVFNGQASTVNITEPQFFVTNVKAYRQGDQAVFIPENHPLPTGFHFSVKPTVSQDHRFVQMAYEIEETRLDSASDHVPSFPVSMLAKPILEDGSKADSVPFTMYLQQPTLLTQRVHQEVVVPCGRTLLFKSWTRSPEIREESEFPVLSSLPYVGDMFKNVSYHRETEDVWIMITPRILINEQEEIRPPAAAAAPTVTDNLQKLQQARVLLEQAEHCRQMGQVESARHIYERVRELCPGSRYAQKANRCLRQLQTHPLTSWLEAPQPTPESHPPGGFYSGGVWMWTGVTKTEECPKAQSYMEKYWQACAEGRLAEATQWAVQALALDPACFSKVREAGWKKNAQPAVAPSAN